MSTLSQFFSSSNSGGGSVKSIQKLRFKPTLRWGVNNPNPTLSNGFYYYYIQGYVLPYQPTYTTSGNADSHAGYLFPWIPIAAVNPSKSIIEAEYLRYNFIATNNSSGGVGGWIDSTKTYVKPGVDFVNESFIRYYIREPALQNTYNSSSPTVQSFSPDGGNCTIIKSNSNPVTQAEVDNAYNNIARIVDVTITEYY